MYLLSTPSISTLESDSNSMLELRELDATSVMRRLVATQSNDANTVAVPSIYPSVLREQSLRSLDGFLPQLAWEPSGRSLLAASATGCACGALAAGLLFPALPALIFGGVLGIYAGVLGASLWALGGGRLLQ